MVHFRAQSQGFHDVKFSVVGIQQPTVLVHGSVKFLHQLIEYCLHTAGHFSPELSSVFELAQYTC